MLNYLDDGLFEAKLKNKKTVRRLLDKYGTLDNFKQNSTLMEDFEYQFAQGDDFVDEVERERQAMMRAMNNLPKQQGTSLDDGDMNVNASLLKPMTSTSIFDTENGHMTPIKYMLNYPNKPMPTLEYFLEQNKKYANNQLTPIMTDAGEGSVGRKSRDLLTKKLQNKVILDDKFYKLLAMDESSNNYNAYNPTGGGFGAIGKYQMRKPILQDLGYIDKNGNFTGKNNINSVDDFFNNHKIQEEAIQDMMNVNYKYLETLNLLKYIGMDVSGIVRDKLSNSREKKNVNFKITLRGLLAAAHREGVGVLRDYLKLLEKKDKNYFIPRNEISRDEISHYNNIEERLFYYQK